MPDDFVIVTGDMIQVTITPPAIVPQLMAPVPLIGTSQKVVLGGKPICLEGDDHRESVAAFFEGRPPRFGG